MDCKNCGKIFYDDYKFCPDCGQDKREKLTIPLLFRNTFGNYFSVDSRILKSFIPLIVKPGKLAKVFVEGKRHLYLHPARFYLFSTIVFFFLFSFVNINQNDSKFQFGPQTLFNDIEDFLPNDSVAVTFLGEQDVRYLFPHTIDSLFKAEAPMTELMTAFGSNVDSSWINKLFTRQIIAVYKKNGAGLEERFINTIPIALFFLLPIFALFIKLFHRKKGTFAECLVFSFYFFTFVFTLFIVTTIFALISGIPSIVIALTVLGPVVYLILALRYFFNQKTLPSILKSLGIFILYSILILPITLIIVGLSTFIFY